MTEKTFKTSKYEMGLSPATVVGCLGLKILVVLFAHKLKLFWTYDKGWKHLIFAMQRGF